MRVMWVNEESCDLSRWLTATIGRLSAPPPGDPLMILISTVVAVAVIWPSFRGYGERFVAAMVRGEAGRTASMIDVDDATVASGWEDVGPERAQVVDQRWFILDEVGRWLGVVTTPQRFTVHQITRERLIGVWQDENDVEYVRAYRLRR